MSTRAADLFRRVDAFEHGWCVRLNRSCALPGVREMFAAVSRLGDGVFWYTLVLLLPVIYGEAGLYPALRMAIVGFSGVALYKYLKSRLVRERPYISLTGIVPGARATVNRRHAATVPRIPQDARNAAQHHAVRVDRSGGYRLNGLTT